MRHHRRRVVAILAIVGTLAALVIAAVVIGITRHSNIAVAVDPASPTAATLRPTADGGTVIFSDSFAGTSPGSAWTVISRHGEYAQKETECHTPQQVSVANGTLTIGAVRQDSVCGDFNLDGTVRHRPSTYPYAAGDVQWSKFNFTYGRVTVRAKFPAQNTRTWPAIWLLGSNCQATNPKTADVGYGGCPALGAPGYVEIDSNECYTSRWCQLALAQPGHSFPRCNKQPRLDTNWHDFTLDWQPDSVTTYVDGLPTGCRYTKADGYAIPSTPMFLIMQIQTGGISGTPNNSQLPTSLQVRSVTVTQPNPADPCDGSTISSSRRSSRRVPGQ